MRPARKSNREEVAFSWELVSEMIMSIHRALYTVGGPLHCKLYSHGTVEETYLVFDSGGRPNLAAPLPPLTAGNTFTPSLYEVTFQPIAIDVQGPPPCRWARKGGLD